MNTPSWTNGKFGCEKYERLSLCANGMMASIPPMMKLFYGKAITSNNPELNCCACGKTGGIDEGNFYVFNTITTLLGFRQ